MAGSNDDMPPWLTPVDEMEDQQSGGLFAGNMKKIVVGLALVVVAIFIIAMWMMYDRPADDFERPIEVIADMSPIKVKPEDTGGKEILDQDKDVYKRITGEGDEKQPTALGAEAEEPVSELPVDEVREEIKEASEAIEKPTEKVIPKPRPKPVVEKPVAKKPEPKVTLPSGKHKIQLGAYSAKTGAEKFWLELQSRFPAIFGNMSDEYIPLTRNGRTLYRLRAGPVANRAEADRLCLQLKAKQLACMVVDPK